MKCTLSSQNSSGRMPVAWSCRQDHRRVAFTPVAESHLADDGGLQVAGCCEGLDEVRGCPRRDHRKEASSSLWGEKVHNKMRKLETSNSERCERYGISACVVCIIERWTEAEAEAVGEGYLWIEQQRIRLVGAA